ncbi:MAG: DnaJ family molecular chaperone [Luteimonas sp.]
MGKLLGVIAGLLLVRAEPLLGALVGLLLGHAVDSGWFSRRRGEDPYQVLGVSEEASDADIDLARRRLLARHHPDRAADGAHRRESERQSRAINTAYDRIRTLRKTSRPR